MEEAAAVSGAGEYRVSCSVAVARKRKTGQTRTTYTHSYRFPGESESADRGSCWTARTAGDVSLDEDHFAAEVEDVSGGRSVGVEASLASPYTCERKDLAYFS